MKKLLLFSIAIICSASIIAQVSFTNQNNLIENYPTTQSISVDVDGDFLVDVVRISESGVGVDYQQANGTFNSVFYSLTIQNPPNWSVAAGDIDENGYTDFVLGNGSRVSFLFADDDGNGFVEQTHPEYIFSQRSNLVDIDNDGDLDAFVCHDVDESHPYRNEGNQNMVLDQDFIQTLDLAGNYASLWVDYDNDGDTDMYLTKCRQGSSPGDPERTNAMYRNNGDGSFTEVAESINMADNAQSWATIFHDFDNDGDFDAFTVNHDFKNRFYENDGTGVYTDIIESTGINTTDLGAWENQGADFNNDGFVDIFSELSRELYINNGDMTFTGMDLPFDEGAIGDFNNDGFLDVSRGGDLWINDGNSNNWVKVCLRGEDSNLNGVGARVIIHGEWGTQMREIRSGQGFSHMSSLIGHFGIGTSTEIEKIVIQWPSGTEDVILNPEINTQHLVTEGEIVLSNSDAENNRINLYPNPTSDIINFSINDLDGTPVRVIDLNGRVVLNTVVSSSNTINIEALVKGVYFVQFEIDKKAINHKIIKN